MQEMQPVPSGAPSDAVSEAFHVLAQTYEALLATLTDKASIFQQFFFVGPTTAALRAFGSVIDVGVALP